MSSSLVLAMPIDGVEWQYCSIDLPADPTAEQIAVTALDLEAMMTHWEGIIPDHRAHWQVVPIPAHLLPLVP